LVFVGDGLGRAELQRRVDELGLREQVLFTGKRPHDQTARFYAAADLFLMPSVTEVNPLTLGESLAAGTPVVAVDSFSAREIVTSGESGLIVPMDETAFCATVRGLVAQPERIKTMGQRAREAAIARSQSTAAQRTEQLYRRLIAQRNAVPVI
jgi:1,2-diacylglycerol 3-alpha-glucosyltransferase